MNNYPGEVAELVEGVRLLSECRSKNSYPGFESQPLRQSPAKNRAFCFIV